MKEWKLFPYRKDWIERETGGNGAETEVRHLPRKSLTFRWNRSHQRLT